MSAFSSVAEKKHKLRIISHTPTNVNEVRQKMPTAQRSIIQYFGPILNSVVRISDFIALRKKLN